MFWIKENFEVETAADTSAAVSSNRKFAIDAGSAATFGSRRLLSKLKPEISAVTQALSRAMEN
ncbi:hypothetical protein [Bradyrhizobium genosp. A]|uniref:hypothetical protein n=1 Tax=Bradyrhizobium genosp. A TaxID=83626 RepID=UPI003CECACE2